MQHQRPTYRRRVVYAGVMALLLALVGRTARAQAAACSVDYAAATLHDERYQPKPAYHEVVQALLDHGL